MSESMTFDKFVKHIADHNGVYTRGTVQGVILDMCECLVEMLLEGKKVQLGALGDFFISLNSVGAESLKAFTAANIKSINVVFTPGADFDGLLEKAKFNPVASPQPTSRASTWCSLPERTSTACWRKRSSTP